MMAFQIHKEEPPGLKHLPKLYESPLAFGHEIEGLYTQSVHYSHPSIQADSSCPNLMDTWVSVCYHFQGGSLVNNR